MTLVITRGYPGSGKTTYARQWVAEDEGNRRRVNRDDLRFSLFGRYTDVDEGAVTKAQRALVETFLRQRKDVIVDDTNLRLRTVKDWVHLANRHAHQVAIVDMVTGVEESILRAMDRAATGGREVPESVIRDFAKRYPMPWPEVDLPAVVEPDFLPVYPDERKRPAIIVDLDGTLAIHQGRSPYDYTKVGTDALSDRADSVITAFYVGEVGAREHDVIFLSGRPDSCRKDTVHWLESHDWFPDRGDSSTRLFMRKAGDDRADYVVKYEIFDREIRDKYDVRLVLDDRDQVVDMWRAIGLTCWQVNRGDF